ncbi:hypothetical protein [Phormidesmis priestleyi]
MVDCLNAARYFVVRSYDSFRVFVEESSSKRRPEASSTEPSLDDLKALGYQKLDEMERESPAYVPVVSKVLEDAFSIKPSNRLGKGEVRDWLNSLLD